MFLSDTKSGEFMNPCIHTCRLNGLNPELVIKYSNIPCSHFILPKIVMAHGMYGFFMIKRVCTVSLIEINLLFLIKLKKNLKYFLIFKYKISTLLV